MKRIFSVLCLLAIVGCLAGPALAEKEISMGLRGGYQCFLGEQNVYAGTAKSTIARASDVDADGFSVGVVFNFPLTENVYIAPSIDYGSEKGIETIPVMVNLKYYWRADKKFRPYLGAGMGALMWDACHENISADGVEFAVNALGGMDYKCGERFAVFAEADYIFTDSGRYEVERETYIDRYSYDFSNVGIQAGLAVRF